MPPGSILLPITHGHLGAPALPAHGGRPVVLFSPGSGDDRVIATTLVEELASRGYVVVTIDDTHDAEEVEFPGGRIEPRTIPRGEQYKAPAIAVRDADTRFVLDELALMRSGTDPDAEHRPLPADLARSLDLSRPAIQVPAL